jgi:L-lactate permease
MTPKLDIHFLSETRWRGVTPMTARVTRCFEMFAHWTIVFIGQWFENYKSFWAAFLNSVSYASILTRMAWATFWATFPRTHLVTLMTAHTMRKKFGPGVLLEKMESSENQDISSNHRRLYQTYNETSVTAILIPYCEVC